MLRKAAATDLHSKAPVQPQPRRERENVKRTDWTTVVADSPSPVRRMRRPKRAGKLYPKAGSSPAEWPDHTSTAVRERDLTAQPPISSGIVSPGKSTGFRDESIAIQSTDGLPWRSGWKSPAVEHLSPLQNAWREYAGTLILVFGDSSHNRICN